MKEGGKGRGREEVEGRKGRAGRAGRGGRGWREGTRAKPGNQLVYI